MASNATANSLNSDWKQEPLLGPGGIIGIGVALAVALIVTLILSFIWWKMKNQQEPEEHNAELPQDHQPPMPELPQRDFHAGEAATDCPVCLEEFVESESLVELPTCLHAFHPACIEAWLTRNHASCPVCRLHIELQVDSDV
ncbi:e3 ubiquitin-protein ligase atl15 [Quercus suber]|uniref:E3 ubiquitin-protein ligase atl15 n=1 Tax=Quercus suber TaxID=58331 RepID=A0AAW0JS67_QUESU|nr:E3 ubiquitin-protein ligase RNF181-like [Quercus suber]